MAYKNNWMQKATEDIPAGKNAEIGSFMQKVMAIAGDRQTDDLNVLIDRFQKYIELCAEQDKKVGNMSAYLAMGISKVTASHWRSGRSTVERQKFIQNVDTICAAYREEMMLDGKLNPIVGIFWQKCYDGLRDNAPDVANDALPEYKTEDADQIREKYKDIITE